MNEDAQSCGIVLVVSLFLAIIWYLVECRLEKLRAKRDADFAESIKHLPVEMQIRIWSRRSRRDAEE